MAEDTKSMATETLPELAQRFESLSKDLIQSMKKEQADVEKLADEIIAIAQMEQDLQNDNNNAVKVIEDI
jgi:hypothetical protein